MNLTKLHAGQRLVRHGPSRGLVSVATVVETRQNSVVLRWDGCEWENEYSFSDPEDIAILSDMELAGEQQRLAPPQPDDEPAESLGWAREIE